MGVSELARASHFGSFLQGSQGGVKPGAGEGEVGEGEVREGEVREGELGEAGE